VKVWDALTGDLLFNQSFGSAEPKSGPTVGVGPKTTEGEEERLAKLAEPKPGPTVGVGPVTSYQIKLSPDFGHTAVRDKDDGTIRVCDTRSGKRLFILKEQVDDFNFLVFSPDGRRIMAIGKDRKVHVWDLRSGDEVCTIEGGVSLHSTLFSPDSRYLAMSAKNALINLWNAGSGLRAVTISQSSSSLELTPFLFSADGQRLVSRRAWRAHSESGNFLGVVYEYKVWDARSGGELSRLEGLGGLSGGPTHQNIDNFAPRLRFSPDNRRLFQIGSDGLVRAWDAESGQRLQELKGHVGAVYDLEVSSDGRRIVSAGEDRTVRIWDFDSGQELLALRGHPHPVIQLSLSADGRCLTSIGSDGTVMFWDTRDKRR
jgi:WD40 repeat protein